MRRSSLLPTIFALSLIITSTIVPRPTLGQEYQRANTTGIEEGDCSQTDIHCLFWRDRLISYVIDGSGCPDLDMGHTRSAIVRSFNTWESEPCTDLFFSFEGYVNRIEPNHFTGEADGFNLIVWLDEWPYDSAQVANTSIIWNERTGEIADVDITLNAQDYYWTISDRSITDIENVLVHEIGHLLGFAHTTDPDASLYDGYSPGEIVKRDLSGTDIRGLCEVYPAGAPTPDQPDLGIEDLELSSGGCQCRSASSSRGRDSRWLFGALVGALALVVALRRRRTSIF